MSAHIPGPMKAPPAAAAPGREEPTEAAPDLLAVLRDLLDWEAHMGGWDAPCWQRARQAVRKAGRKP